MEYFENGFKTGVYARLSIEDIPQEFSTYFLWYPEYVFPIERPLKLANEKHLKSMGEEIAETSSSDVASALYNADAHSILKKYERANTFEDKRRWLFGFWSGVIVGNYFRSIDVE